MTQQDSIWEYNGLSIIYRDNLDGDGRAMAQGMSRYLAEHHQDTTPFGTCYEWCSGPGFIGFALLVDNICERLVLADINPEAVSLAKETVVKNGLENRVDIYESDNLRSIPEHHRFDLVVSNPPNYYALNPLHPSYDYLKSDLRPNDPEWRLHREFYSSISQFLNPQAVLCIEEVDPFATKCFMPNAAGDNPLWGPEPFDVRPNKPIYDFREMIATGGLTFDRVDLLPHEQMPIHLVISHYDKNPEADRIILKPGLNVLRDLVETDTVAIHAYRDSKWCGHFQLAKQQLWLIDIVKLLMTAGDAGVPRTIINESINAPTQHIDSAIQQLRKMRWIC
jgi:SAM-dependent methyltransferase